MASLTGKRKSDTYDSLLKLDDNDQLTSAKKKVTDGYGNETGLSLDNLGNVDIAGDVNVTGAIQENGVAISETYASTDAINTETQLREAADNVLQSNIDQEVLDRTNADAVLQGEIDQEILDRQAGDAALEASKIPYTGATGSVDLGANQITSDAITFNQSPVTAGGVGVLKWNDIDGTLDLGLKGGNVTLQIGQEFHKVIRNNTSFDFLEGNYQAIKISGALGGRLTGDLAIADADINSATTLGIVTENIIKNESGYLTLFGSVREIDTTGNLQGEVWQDGDVLYLSGTTAGALTNIKPLTPLHLVTIGYVEYAHSQHGSIFVKIDNGYEMDELHDVLISNIQVDDNLVWDGQKWINSNALKSNIDGLAQEILDREDADTALQDQITSNNLAISANTNAISTESSNRMTEDALLQNQINTNTDDIAANSAGISQEITNRTNADISLQGQITSNDADILANSNAISQEVTDRTDADLILQGNIDSESSTRSAADVLLQSNIDTEASIRGNADTALEAAINQEILDRTNADSALQGQIDSNDLDIAANTLAISNEITNRSNADSTLQSNINAEALTRSNDDATLQSNIDAEALSRSSEDAILQSEIDALSGDVTNLGNDLNNYQLLSEKAQANGYASLDASGKIPESQLPDSVLGSLEYKGAWDASTDTPTLPTPSTSNNGWFYKVSVAGNYMGIDFHVGDWALSNGTSWEHIHVSETIADVFGRTGSVVAIEADYAAFYPTIGDLNNEIAARSGADSNLQSQISSNDTDISNNAAAIAQELLDRAAADNVLQGNINSEATTRATADADLQSQIDGVSASIPSVGDGTLTITGTGVLGGSGTFTANQSTNASINISHDAVTRSNTSSSESPTPLGSFTAIDSITTSTEGHITAVNTKTITLPDAATAAPANDAIITIGAGTGISGGGSFTTDQASNQTITISHGDTSTLEGVYGSSDDSTKIDTITLDANGHITAITTGATGDITGVTAGGGMTGGGTSGSVTISHADTSAQVSVNNAGRTYIQDITLDTYGHITGITSATDSDDYVGTITSVTAGTGLAGGTITSSGTISHGDTSALSGVYGSASDNVKIDTITLDEFGHITAITTGATGDIEGITAGGGLTGGGTSGTPTISHADTSALSGAYGGANNGIVVETITLDGYGHITAVGTRDLDGRFLGISAKAADSNLLDGLDSSYFAAASHTHSYVPLSGASYIQSSGRSTSWGSTNGTSTGGFNTIMGTGTGATWLISGTSNGTFRAGWQALDSNGSSRFYVGSNYYNLSGANGSIWHSGNDGSGSGLDADYLDGQHGSYYQPASTAITTSNIGSQSVSYASSAGNADTLDGSHASAFATSGHNHTYDVNNVWLRDNGDNANVKLYGNTRQMAFRTDGTTEYATGVGGYAFAWMYGGDASGNRRMLLGSDGRLWTSYSGWLDTAFASASHNHSGVYQPAGTYNTIIGTDTDIDTSGATIIDNLYMTDGVITSHGTRTLTLADLGYTGETNATADQSASEILTLIKSVDGSSSGLDADLLDGQHGSYYQPASSAITTSNIGSQSVNYAASAGSYSGTISVDKINTYSYRYYNGYVKLPNFVLIQWGYFSSSTNGAQTIYFPTSFSGNGYSFTTTLGLASVSLYSNYVIINRLDFSGTYTHYWMAVGSTSIATI